MLQLYTLREHLPCNEILIRIDTVTPPGKLEIMLPDNCIKNRNLPS